MQRGFETQRHREHGGGRREKGEMEDGGGRREEGELQAGF